MIGGKLKDNLLYRGATPINNVYNRALTVNELIEKDGIKFVIDLSDSEEDFINNMNEELTDSYINKLYENNKILFLGIGADYSTKDYGQKVVQAFISIINEEGPIYIHCTEGKDRTGFVCLLLEALAGFSEEEILNDYMKTYDNYYGINPSTNLKLTFSQQSITKLKKKKLKKMKLLKKLKKKKLKKMKKKTNLVKMINL